MTTKKAFSIRTAISLCAILGLTLAIPAWAKGKPGGGGGGGSSSGCSTVNVTSTLFGTDSANNNEPFQILDDGQGAYTTLNTHKPKDSVTSEISSTCFWTLDTTTSTSRGIDLNLSYQLNGSPAPFTGTQQVQGRLVTHCDANSNNNGIDVGSMKTIGQTLTCPINLGFYAPSGVWYNLAINPYNWGGTSQMQVTCTGVSGGLCNQWTMAPDPATSVINLSTNQTSAIAALVSPPCVGCSGGTQLGTYEVAFSFLIQK